MPEQSGVPPARPPTRLFDWKRECPNDVARPFPPFVGSGRGRALAEEDERRKLQDRGLTKEAVAT